MVFVETMVILLGFVGLLACRLNPTNWLDHHLDMTSSSLFDSFLLAR